MHPEKISTSSFFKVTFVGRFPQLRKTTFWTLQMFNLKKKQPPKKRIAPKKIKQSQPPNPTTPHPKSPISTLQFVQRHYHFLHQTATFFTRWTPWRVVGIPRLCLVEDTLELPHPCDHKSHHGALWRNGGPNLLRGDDPWMFGDQVFFWLVGQCVSSSGKKFHHVNTWISCGFGEFVCLGIFIDMYSNKTQKIGGHGKRDL